jgi:hypothetical protein
MAPAGPFLWGFGLVLEWGWRAAECVGHHYAFGHEPDHEMPEEVLERQCGQSMRDWRRARPI